MDWSLVARDVERELGMGRAELGASIRAGVVCIAPSQSLQLALCQGLRPPSKFGIAHATRDLS